VKKTKKISETDSGFYNMIGKSMAMKELFNFIKDLADISSNVLITGESGTGKELLAEALHYTGVRRNNPFIKVTSLTLPENLMESELFSYVKGFFTGATKERSGRLGQPQSGTIFLDEIGDMSLSMQLRILRILQESESERAGDINPVKVDIRFIMATNQDLTKKVREGSFRKDLYYRLKVVEIKLPPLRERKEDIPLLTEHFIRRYNNKFHRNISFLSVETEKIFMNYSWPGNIRELEHVMEYAFIKCKKDVIISEHLPRELLDEEKNPGFSPEEEEKRIREALELSEGKKARAARILGMSRPTLYKRMEDYGIYW